MDAKLVNSTVERLKVEVCTCTRLLNMEGILGYSGHVSVRLPEGDRLLLQSFDASRNDLVPDELYILDLDGNQRSDIYVVHLNKASETGASRPVRLDLYLGEEAVQKR